ncbi:hypothetical protein AVEN_189482-2-1, partial [Araneus ventricosus]
DGHQSDDHASQDKDKPTFDKNLYLYSEEMAERPHVASLLNTLANYDVSIPTVEDQEGKEGKAAPKQACFANSQQACTARRDGASCHGELMANSYCKRGWRFCIVSLPQFRFKLDASNLPLQGNECADQLAEEAITKGDLFLLPKPLSYLKAEIKSAALSIWQDNWDNGETGRSTHDIVPRVSNKPVGWNREEIMFVTGHGPFPSYLHRFSSNTG